MVVTAAALRKLVRTNKMKEECNSRREKIFIFWESLRKKWLPATAVVSLPPPNNYYYFHLKITHVDNARFFFPPPIFLSKVIKTLVIRTSERENHFDF